MFLLDLRVIEFTSAVLIQLIRRLYKEVYFISYWLYLFYKFNVSTVNSLSLKSGSDHFNELPFCSGLRYKVSALVSPALLLLLRPLNLTVT